MAESAPTIGSVIAMSRELARLAEASDWEAFRSQQDARDAALRALFERTPGDENTRQELINAIHEIRALDQQTLHLLQSARDASASAVRQTRQEHAGLSAYQRIANQR